MDDISSLKRKYYIGYTRRVRNPNEYIDGGYVLRSVRWNCGWNTTDHLLYFGRALDCTEELKRGRIRQIRPL